MSALSSTERRAVTGSTIGRRSGPGLPDPRLRLPHIGRRLATTGLLVVLGVALLAAVPGLRDVLREIHEIDLGWVALAVALELASAVSFVVVFRLFFDQLDGRDARALAWTAQGSGALLPGGGVGGLAIGGWLTSLTGVPVGWIVRRSAGLFFLGALVSTSALVGAGVALMAGAPGPHYRLTVVLPTILVAVGIVLVAALPAMLRSRSRAPRWITAIAGGVSEAEQTAFNRHPSWRLLGAVGYLAFDVAVLWVLLRAVGHGPSIAVVVLAYSIGYAANSLPIPGGIGVLDAGLTGALVLYGVSPVHAAAAVIVYHAIAFWVPGLGGMLAYLRLRPRLLRADARATANFGPTQVTLASEEVHHARTDLDPQTDRSRLGRCPQQRARTRTLHGSLRQAQSTQVPRQPRPDPRDQP
jgi:uncharacterized membrane protein YbhN (UPF0104 family)